MPRIVLKIRPDKDKGENFKEWSLFEGDIETNFKSIIDKLNSYISKVEENFKELSIRNNLTLEETLKSEIQFKNINNNNNNNQ
jgi:hypothetical protein